MTAREPAWPLPSPQVNSTTLQPSFCTQQTCPQALNAGSAAGPVQFVHALRNSSGNASVAISNTNKVSMGFSWPRSTPCEHPLTNQGREGAMDDYTAYRHVACFPLPLFESQLHSQHHHTIRALESTHQDSHQSTQHAGQRKASSPAHQSLLQCISQRNLQPQQHACWFSCS